MTRTALLFLPACIIWCMVAQYLVAEEAGTTTTPSAAQTNATGNGSALTLDAVMTLLDKDHDGKVSKEEATGAYGQRFAQWDANNDGFATRQEIHDFRLKRGIDDNGKKLAVAAQQQGGTRKSSATSALVLKEPADWRLEALPIPPTFAPDIPWKGSEEIRFAPGMFDNTSDSYFTCVIAIQVEGVIEPGEAGLKDFLGKYYRGLSGSRAKRQGTPPDLAAMGAEVTALPTEADSLKRYTADVTFFDSFSDGRKIILHVEAQVVPQPALKKTWLLFQVSPSAKDSAVWKTLRQIGAKSVQEASKAPAAAP